MLYASRPTLNLWHTKVCVLTMLALQNHKHLSPVTSLVKTFRRCLARSANRPNGPPFCWHCSPTSFASWTATRRRRTRSTPTSSRHLRRLSTSTGQQRGHVYISRLTWEKNLERILDDWLCVGTITNHIQSTRRRAGLHWWRLFRPPTSPPPHSPAGFPAGFSTGRAGGEALSTGFFD